MIKLLDEMKNQRQHERLGKYYRDLIRKEAKMGGQLFGPTPAGVRREFFCLDEHTWVWHEEWEDENGEHQIMTTRYTIRPDGILKSQNSRQYEQVSDEEAERLCLAARLYFQYMKTGNFYPA